MGSADLLGGELTQAEEAHLPFLHQPCHGADAFLHRHVRVGAVLIVEVDGLAAEALQALLTGFLHVLRPAADAQPLTVGSPPDAELRRHGHLVPTVREGLGEQLFVVSGAVHVGGVEVVDAKVDGRV